MVLFCVLDQSSTSSGGVIKKKSNRREIREAYTGWGVMVLERVRWGSSFQSGGKVLLVARIRRLIFFLKLRKLRGQTQNPQKAFQASRAEFRRLVVKLPTSKHFRKCPIDKGVVLPRDRSGDPEKNVNRRVHGSWILIKRLFITLANLNLRS